MKRLLLLIIFSLIFTSKAIASGPALGIHLLDPNELTQASDLVAGSSQQPGAVTVVLRSDDRDLKKWQAFFDLAADKNIIPIVRLATNITPNSWRQPVKKDLIDHAEFLNFLNWHRDFLPIVIFNEPNHASEWGGRVNPVSYAQILDFALNWFHTEPKSYQVLPAGLDAAAPNGPNTLDSFTFLSQMINSQPQILEKIDGWTSHSYPNPGFVAAPTNPGKASINGFKHELAFLKQYSTRDFAVYITETGWKRTPKNEKLLPEYYRYSLERVWNDPRVKAITPFVFTANDGPFKQFSFIYPDGSPTDHYLTWRSFQSQSSLFSQLLL